MMKIFLSLYSLLIYILTPFFILRLKIKSRKNKDYGQRILERFGLYDKSQLSATHDLWFHAVSFGEVEVARLLIKHYLSQGKRICVTTTTPTGSAHLLNIFGEQITHVYLPFEWPGAIKRFLKKMQPKLLVIIETELWPNLIKICNKKQLPIIITNARLSQRSCNGYAYLRPVMKNLMNSLTLVLAQTKADGQRFLALGLTSNKLHINGNLKFDTPIFKPSLKEVNYLEQDLFLNRQVIIAASTHVGEDELILKSFGELKKHHSELVLIIAPRHPERFNEICKLVEQEKLTWVSRTQNKSLAINDSVFILDSLGELQLFYSIATIAFVGGSLVNHGGHNVLEPLRAKVPVIVGSYMFNFRFITEELLKVNGLIQVKEQSQLTNSMLNLINDKNLQLSIVKAAEEFINCHQGALKKNIAIINSNF